MPVSCHESVQNLPTELLTVITDYIDMDEDLLALAATSKTFHNLSLRTLFLRHDFDPLSKNLRLVSFDATLHILQGLAISLDVVGKSLDHLSYDCGHILTPDRFITELRLLGQYSSKLNSIKSASLHLALTLHDKRRECRDASITLLNTILGRSCRDIHVTASEISSFLDVPRQILTSNPAHSLKNYWPVRGPPPSTAKDLRSCFIQTFPSFLRPFYFHTLSVNSSGLTELSFKNVFGSGADWAIMLAHLTFPHLRRLSVIFGVIPRDPLIKFLAKHPTTLAYFEYHHIRYEPRPKHPQRSTALTPVFHDRLETLITSPEHIINFLPSFSSFAAISNVTVKIEENTPNFYTVDAALKSLAQCICKIILTLEISQAGLGFGAWFDKIFNGPVLSNSSRRPEAFLHCVESLVMDNGSWGFSDARMATRLPIWLRLLPKLRMLTLVAGGPVYKQLTSLDGHVISAEDLLVGLREACPDLCIETVMQR